MLFSVRMVNPQPESVSNDAWQQIVSDQLAAVKALRDAGKIKSIYRETGIGVLAIFDVADAQQMDQELAQLPMFRHFSDLEVHAIWDMGPALNS